MLVEGRAGNARLRRGSTGRAKLTLLVGGVPTSSDWTVGVSVVNAAGTVLVTSSGVTGSTGVYEAEIADTLVPEVDTLDASWTATHEDGEVHRFWTRHEVVGDRLVDTARMRVFDRADLADATAFAEADLFDALAAVEEFFEQYCRVSLVQRHSALTLDGTGTANLDVPKARVTRVLAASIDGAAVSTESLVPWESGRVYREGGWAEGRQNVVIRVEHGHRVPPPRAERAALLLLEDILPARHGSLSRAMIATDETGTYRLAIAGGRDRPTGLPEVDFILNQLQEPLLV